MPFTDFGLFRGVLLPAARSALDTDLTTDIHHEFRLVSRTIWTRKVVCGWEFGLVLTLSGKQGRRYSRRHFLCNYTLAE
ncbi:hypothetical protein EDD16DRAFT_1596103 [Pisolithus croceorrhizus]|nr:hypothetical protein EDD16DRAFT_1596103 [Pisolithus croceorrhizus]KAI6130568.1 hypothetical protein EV401DRAFT_1923052 [Pisolithus croceorrhizus]